MKSFYLDENENNELINTLKNEIEILRQKNKKLFIKKKNLIRANLRLRNKLKFQSKYIISTQKPSLFVENTKFKPILCPIPEKNEQSILQNTYDTEWDYIDNDEIKKVSV